MASAFFWEDSDQLNLIATFLDARSIGSLSCTCCFVRDNLRDACQLRWLAEVRGLENFQEIGCVEHIEIAEAMAGLETSISFRYGSIELEDEALPSIQRVTDMLRRHQHLSISVEGTPPQSKRHLPRWSNASCCICSLSTLRPRGADSLRGALHPAQGVGSAESHGRMCGR